MRKIDLMQVCKSILKRFWLPVLLAALCVAGTLLFISPKPDDVITTWNLDNRYLIDIENADSYEGYSYRKMLAQSVCELLTADADLRKMTTDIASLNRYSITQSNRRIELHLSVKEEDLALMNDLKEAFEERAKEYLDLESGNQGSLKMDVDSLEKTETILEYPSKNKMLILGGMIGFCFGLAILLLKEYIRSPKISDNHDVEKEKCFE